MVYGTTQAYGQSTTLNPALVTAHSQGLSGLTPGMLYYYRVKSKDAAGNLVTSDEFTFTTAQNGSAGIKWLVTDHLGSTRMVINETGSLAGIKRHDFAPFGEELSDGVGIRSASNGYSSDSARQKFTGYERDNETSLDYAQARYFASVQGRFTSVDPLLASGRPSNPQSWNRYTEATHAAAAALALIKATGTGRTPEAAQQNARDIVKNRQNIAYGIVGLRMVDRDIKYDNITGHGKIPRSGVIY